MKGKNERNKKISKKGKDAGLRQITIFEAFGIPRAVNLEIEEYSRVLEGDVFSERDMSLPNEIKTPEFEIQSHSD